MPTISILDPVSHAFARTGDLLFRPFQFKKWAALALSATLLLAGESGFNFSGTQGGSSPGSHGSSGHFSLHAALHGVHHFFDLHFLLIVVFLPILFLLALAFFLLLRWLNARGRFMLLDQVVNDSALIAQPWRSNRTLANSFFLFRLLWDFLCFLTFGLFSAAAFLIAWPDLSHWINTDEFRFGGFFIAGILFFGVAISFAGVLWSIAAFFAFALGTCCVGCLFFILPVVGLYPVAFLTLPVVVFARAYELHFLSQFGDAYQVPWATTTAATFPVVLPTPPTPPAQPPPLP